MSFKFEELNVWKKSLDLSIMVHELTLHFPKEESFILTSQIKSAAVSVALNIAEVSSGHTDAELNKFLGYSLRSPIEVIACLHLGLKRKIISTENFESIYAFTEEIVKMIQAFRKILK